MIRAPANEPASTSSVAYHSTLIECISAESAALVIRKRSIQKPQPGTSKNEDRLHCCMVTVYASLLSLASLLRTYNSALAVFVLR